MDTEIVNVGGDFETLYAALVAEQCVQLPEHYFTCAQFANDTGLAHMTALRILEARVKAGVLATRMVSLEGHASRIYWFTNVEKVK
jgi:hypothetical protein